jgi:hypothetical protein
MSVNHPSDPGVQGAPRLLDYVCLVAASGLLALTTGQWNLPLAAGLVPVFWRGVDCGFSVVRKVYAGLSTAVWRWLACSGKAAATPPPFNPESPGRGPWQ